MPVTFEAALWYEVTVRCNSSYVANPEFGEPGPCINYQREWEVSPVYSNGGQPTIQCGPCQQYVEILTGTLLDPQPVMD